ncbi:hypothetical protein [Bradyrhizobium liaoningense]|uniref:hypothetical protein n=1 Tax=Bradyrhizobium liaoningense TaxID=43992 RepID=UPI001BA452FE|nr:hypothetical protein [Bradyrhizobium liaoningense]MBR0817601.1 hypothetical protein [Bradyrhizobium liaoningense]
MKIAYALRCLLAVLVMASLAMAPLAAPAAAQLASDTMAMDDGAMANEMPCCPDQKAPVQKDDCKDCPFMGLCLMKSIQGMPVAAVKLQYDLAYSGRLALLDDAKADGLGSSPPARPPRS